MPKPDATTSSNKSKKNQQQAGSNSNGNSNNNSSQNGDSYSDIFWNYIDAFFHDTAMMLMALGAISKFVELVILRNDFSVPRFVFSIAGGVLIAAGSALVSYSTATAIWEHYQNQQQQSTQNGLIDSPHSKGKKAAVR